MSKIYRFPFQVRGYELDSFGHVNNAVYLNYFEAARWDLMRSRGISLQNFKEWGEWPVIRKVTVDYLAPTFAGDELIVESKNTETGKTWFVWEQAILRQEKICAKAEFKIVMVSNEGRPISVNQKMLDLFG